MFNQVLGVLGLMKVNINQHIKHHMCIPNILWKVIKFHGSKPPIRGVLSNHLWKYSCDDGIPTSQKSSYCTKLPSGKHTKSDIENGWVEIVGIFPLKLVDLSIVFLYVYQAGKSSAPGSAVATGRGLGLLRPTDRRNPNFDGKDMGKTRGKAMEQAEQSMKKNINKYIRYIFN